MFAPIASNHNRTIELVLSSNDVIVTRIEVIKERAGLQVREKKKTYWATPRGSFDALILTVYQDIKTSRQERKEGGWGQTSWPKKRDGSERNRNKNRFLR